MPGVTDIKIINVGFRFIGVGRITDFEENKKQAAAVKDIYDDLRRELLSFPWNFAEGRVKLSRLAAVPEFQFNYAYLLPSDWLYTVSVHNNDAGVGAVFYKESQLDNQNVLLASDEDIYLRYTVDEKDANKWSPKFRRAMSSAIARDLAITLGNSRALQETMADQAQRDLINAKSVDGITSFPEQRPRGSWANSRSGSLSRGGFGTS